MDYQFLYCYKANKLASEVTKDDCNLIADLVCEACIECAYMFCRKAGDNCEEVLACKVDRNMECDVCNYMELREL